MRIALLEDEAEQAELVALWLEAAEHDCQIYATAKAFMKAVSRESFDLLIVDWMLPDINGDKVVEWVRANLDWPIPIIFVTQRDSEQDIVTALELGADDYMSKPTKRMELIARVNALQRRVNLHSTEEEQLSFGVYHMDANKRTLRLNDTPIDLTTKEFDLALFLFRNAGRVVSRGHILESVWGSTAELNTRTVDTHVSRLRRKLDINEEHGWRLRAVYQHGYRLESAQVELMDADE